MMETNNSETQVYVQNTPNPNALKFIVNKTLKAEGKSTYKTPGEAQNNPLAQALFTIKGIDQLYFFQNTITVSKFSFEEWEALSPAIINCLEERVGEHNPEYFDPDPEAERRKKLGPELLKIEEILDHTIRPGLQGDGGDLRCISYEDNVLLITYEGACGTCPSSTTGTLEAIRGILRDQYAPEIEVYIQPSF